MTRRKKTAYNTLLTPVTMPPTPANRSKAAERATPALTPTEVACIPLLLSHGSLPRTPEALLPYRQRAAPASRLLLLHTWRAWRRMPSRRTSTCTPLSRPGSKLTRHLPMRHSASGARPHAAGTASPRVVLRHDEPRPLQWPRHIPTTAAHSINRPETRPAWQQVYHGEDRRAAMSGVPHATLTAARAFVADLTARRHEESPS